MAIKVLIVRGGLDNATSFLSRAMENETLDHDLVEAGFNTLLWHCYDEHDLEASTTVAEIMGSIGIIVDWPVAYSGLPSFRLKQTDEELKLNASASATANSMAAIGST